MPASSRWPLRLLALLACLALPLGAACWRAPPPAQPSGAAEAARPAPAPAPAAQVPASDDPLAGTWWVFMPDRPYIAFVLSLDPAQGDKVAGSWKSFDWLGTKLPDDLHNISKAVYVTGEILGDTLRLTAPEPMLDANNRPNGQRGDWRIDLKGSNLPGEPRRYAGRAYCTEFDDPAGVAVSLERAFRPWKP